MNKQNNTNPNISEERTKSKEEKIDTTININRWAFLFLFLFAAIFLFIAIGSMAGTYPFHRDSITQELSIANTELFVIIVVLDLISLMLGLYFSWFRNPKPKDDEESTEEEVQDEIVFTDDDNSVKDSDVNEE